MSNFMSNRNSTPDASHSLRPPQSARNTLNGAHPLRSSADMSSALSPQIRPSSEVYPRSNLHNNNNNNNEDGDKAASQWIADLEDFENTLEGMASATLDKEFKDELSAIELWFRVLSEAERTAALYALLQQTTQIQNRFFIVVLEQMAKGHAGVNSLSAPQVNDKGEAIKSLTETMDKIQTESARNSMSRPPPSPFAKRNSGLTSADISALFPEAAAAMAEKKEQYTARTGNQVPTNRNSLTAASEIRQALQTPSISTPAETRENLPLPSPTPWGSQRPSDRPQSSSGQQPMGHFSQPLASAGLRSPRPNQHLGGDNDGNIEAPLISPYTGGNASWASMSNTPMVPNFNTQQSGQPSQAQMVASATASKLSALLTVNNRIALDDAKKYRRPRPGEPQVQLSPNILGGSNVIVVNENGQSINSQLSPQQIAAIQLQHQQALMSGRRSRPHSPAMALGSGGLPTGMSSFASPQAGGYLSAYDASGLPTGMSGMSLNQFGMGHEGYISDHSDARGRSPRGRRGTSKPPEDPTNVNLLEDIPAWLRSLRLHKYTDNLKDMKWQELVELDEKGLEDRGVAAAGARKKMLKTFEQVKEAQAAGKFS